MVGTRRLALQSPHRHRVAFVVQRYGLEVCGGAELHCRWVAEHLAKYFAVEVLTTCALEDVSWANYYPPGRTEVGGVAVCRFPVDRLRRHRTVDALSRRVFGGAHTYLDELDWVRMVGPHSSRLLSHLAAHRDDYDLVVFFSYQYFTTVFGLPIVPERAALVPTAHDDPNIRLDVYNPVFHLPRLIIYNTDTERTMIEWRFRNRHVPGIVVGTGIEAPALPPDPADFRRRHGLDGPFILSIGRIEPSKGSDTLFGHFARYKDSGRGGDLRLVLMGRAGVPIPRRDDLVYLGFVPEEDKFAGIAACSLVVLPSEYESLSMANLEAWMMGKPVLANGLCQVLRDNCVKANGGLYFAAYEEFAEALDLLLSEPELGRKLGESGRRYFEEHYSWEAIERKYVEAILALEPYA